MRISSCGNLGGHPAPYTPRDVASLRRSPAPMTRRNGYVLTALATMAVGLLVHRGVLPLPPVGRDVLGDVLWATMIMWLVSAVYPRAAHTHRAGVAIAICWLVELSQQWRWDWLLALRAHPLGHLVLGSDFDARDLLAYTVGVAVAWCVDWLLLSPRRIAE
jgi:Protein of unknown function (DUF2809)